MIAVIATLKAKEGKEEELVGVLKALGSKVLANESDCKLYQLSRSKSDPQTYVLMERYTDGAALAQHSNTEYFKAGIPNMIACCEGPPQVALYDEIE